MQAAAAVNAVGTITGAAAPYAPTRFTVDSIDPGSAKITASGNTACIFSSGKAG